MRDVSLSAPKFEDFSDDRAAAPRRARAALPPEFDLEPKRERPALARFLRRPRLGVSILVGIAGLALVGVPLNALFLQDGRHPAPLFSGHTLAPEPVQTVAKPSTHPAPADIAHAEPEAVRTEPAAHARATKPESRSDAAALTAEILKSTPPAPAAAVAKPAKKQAVASRDAIGALLGPAPKPAVGAKPAAAPRQPAAVHAAAAPVPAAAAAGPDQNVVSVQRALQRLGYVVKPDGAMTPEMRKTIEKFERDNGLPITGQLGPKVVKLLSTRTASQH